jgi:hypothetical protein
MVKPVAEPRTESFGDDVVIDLAVSCAPTQSWTTGLAGIISLSERRTDEPPLVHGQRWVHGLLCLDLYRRYIARWGKLVHKGFLFHRDGELPCRADRVCSQWWGGQRVGAREETLSGATVNQRSGGSAHSGVS